MTGTIVSTDTAGIGATLFLLGGDDFGGFELTTGTGTADGGLVELDFSGSDLRFGGHPITLVPLNANASGLTVSASSIGSPGSTGIYFASLSGIADSTVYRWAYRIG
jgi:hypothetical protein